MQASLLILVAFLFAGCAYLAGEEATIASTNNTHLMTGPLIHQRRVPPPTTEEQMLKELQRPR